jgi:hypothetical protein
MTGCSIGSKGISVKASWYSSRAALTLRKIVSSGVSESADTTGIKMPGGRPGLGQAVSG